MTTTEQRERDGNTVMRNLMDLETTKARAPKGKETK